jgi:RNA polymerase sigma factor (sigma-70 family)
MSAMNTSEAQSEQDDVVYTAQLRHRPAHAPDHEAENRALVSLAQVLANPPRDILQRLVEAALELCKAGSAGISIIEDHLGEKVFRWHALTGALAPHRWGTTPRDFSPCGIVIDRNATQLMHLPELQFPYLANVKPQVVEVLLVPFCVQGQSVGTIWIVTHDQDRKFDAEDARLVEELGQVAAKAYQLASSVAASQLADRRKGELLAALARELRGPQCEGPQQLAMNDWGRQLQLMKHSVNDALDRSRIRLGTATPLPRPDQEGGRPAVGDSFAVRPSLRALSVAASVPLPRGPARNSEMRTMTGSPQGPSASTLDAISLVQRMRRGDQRALEELYDCTVGSVYGFALAFLKSEEDAEEVVCDTYAQAWRQSERFDAQRAAPIGWLLTMCRGRAIDRLRHNRSRRVSRMVPLESVSEIAQDALTPEDLLSLFHDGSRVRCALAALSPKRLELVGLAFFDGLSFREMAERTGLPLGTVKSHVRRALAELRSKLQTSAPL